jgi:proline iminopeptidase
MVVLASVNMTLAQGEERLLQVNGTEINVRVMGKGSPIIIVHGGPGLNHTYFLPHLNALAAKHQLVYIDQRACGKSSGQLDSSQMTLNWLVKDIEAIRKELKLGKVTVLAHSWGGLLGMLYAARYPESMRALILSNSVSPKAGEFDQQTNTILNARYSSADSALRSQIIASQAFRAGDLEAYRSLFRLSFRQSFYDKRYSDSLNLVLPVDFLQKRKVLFYMAKKLAGFNFYPELKNIKCPTLIVHGDDDAIPPELPQKIHQGIPASKLAVMNDAGHFPFVEKKKEFLNTINDFLDRK